MALEIERKFKVAADWAIPEGARRAALRQAYLSPADASTEFRVRQCDMSYFMTVKVGKKHAGAGAAVREEIEFEIGESTFSALWALAMGDCLSKTRWHIPWDGHEITVDVYDGVLDGLRVAEVEFADLEAAERFVPPPWFEEELTGRAEWGNRALARCTHAHADVEELA